MNCINCGAPPSHDDFCKYCNSVVSKRKHNTVDDYLFLKHKKMFKDCDWDNSRKRLAITLAKQGHQYTAGQVRSFAKTCDWDSGKIDIFKALQNNILNLEDVLECVDILDWDENRELLMKLSRKKEVVHIFEGLPAIAAIAFCAICGILLLFL